MAAIELGAPYWVYNPAQTDYFAINSPGDAKFIGYVSDITGLDDAEVRENAQNINAGDGGLNGRFYRGRRPWTITGFIMPTMPVTARSAAADRIADIMDQCMEADGYLMWTPSDTITKFITFRKQQPFRDTKGQSNVQRNFLLSGVAADWRVYDHTQKQVGPTVAAGGAGQWTALPVVHNSGKARAPFTFTLTGPTNGVWIWNFTTGVGIRLSTNLATGQTLVVDNTGRYPTVNVNAVNHYGDVVVADSDWSVAVEKGDNNFQFWTSSPTAATQGTLTWRDAWP